MVQWVGFAAGTLTALALVPQVVKTRRTRSAEDLSAVMLGAQTVGIGLWIVYGAALGSLPMMVTNSITFSLSLLLLVFKFRYAPPRL
jgi:MtN3 and saliva related transmembrane protein